MKRAGVWILLIGILLFPTQRGDAAPAAPQAFIGANLVPLELTVEGEPNQNAAGLTAARVHPGYGAHKAGLRRGDVVYKLDGKTFDSTEKAVEAINAIAFTKKPGDRVDVDVYRNGQPMTFTIILDPVPALLADAAILADLFATRDPHEKVIRKILSDHKLEEDYRKLADSFAKHDRNHFDPFISSQFVFAHRQPLKGPALAKTLTDGIAGAYAGDKPLADAVERAGQLIGNGYALDGVDPIRIKRKPKEHLEQIVSVVNAATDAVDAALAALTKEELEQALAQIDPDTVQGPDQAIAHLIQQIPKILHIDRRQLMVAAQILARLDNDDYLSALGNAHLDKIATDKIPKIQGVSGKVVWVQETRAGRLIIGGKGRNVYDTDAAIIIDLGGNDVYKNRAGSSGVAGRRVGLVLDLAGNDQYVSKKPFAQGCGLFGVGMLIDADGNDTYKAPQAAQGCGLIGVGILVDKKGKDRYEVSREIGQGAGVFGLGLLVEGGGNDVFGAGLYAQAFAMTGGAGVLLEMGGNDKYRATGVHPSTYADDPKGTFTGMSQGYAMGSRFGKPQLSGGVAALIDVQGKDIYESGNFSQAGGFWFGLGMIRDMSGNDRYTGTRYSQGFGCHMGVGILMDDAGDDRYNCTRTANQGSAWDHATGIFIDGAGNDRYTTDGVIIQGGAAQSSYALFVDAAGTDAYRGANPGAVQPKDAQYGPPGLCLGFFLDCGGKRDSYQAGRKNNSVHLGSTKEAKYGFFADIRRALPSADKAKFGK